MRMYVGAYRGTGSELEIEKVGFRPAVVELVNVDDASIMKHMEGMDDASFVLQKAGSTSVVTTEGVTLTDKGFTVGTNADLNTSGELVRFVAWGN